MTLQPLVTIALEVHLRRFQFQKPILHQIFRLEIHQIVETRRIRRKKILRLDFDPSGSNQNLLDSFKKCDMIFFENSLMYQVNGLF